MQEQESLALQSATRAFAGSVKRLMDMAPNALGAARQLGRATSKLGVQIIRRSAPLLEGEAKMLEGIADVWAWGIERLITASLLVEQAAHAAEVSHDALGLPSIGEIGAALADAELHVGLRSPAPPAEESSAQG